MEVDPEDIVVGDAVEEVDKIVVEGIVKEADKIAAEVVVEVVVEEADTIAWAQDLVNPEHLRASHSKAATRALVFVYAPMNCS